MAHLRQTGSAFMLGLVSAMRTAPLLLIGMFGGVLADRLDRRKLLVASQIANMVLNLILAVLIVTHSLEVWHVFVTALCAGVVMSFQQPTMQAMIPNLVGERDLMNANALWTAAANISRSVGPALAGFIVGFFGMGAPISPKPPSSCGRAVSPTPSRCSRRPLRHLSPRCSMI
ncbi:MAG: MFS transporter [Chloroflexi bacterium]|nr:MFS transporter [Chloroflexota bacterium]